MNSRHRNRLTLIELLILFMVLIGLGVVGGAVYVAIHFIGKVW